MLSGTISRRFRPALTLRQLRLLGARGARCLAACADARVQALFGPSVSSPSRWIIRSTGADRVRRPSLSALAQLPIPGNACRLRGRRRQRVFSGTTLRRSAGRAVVCVGGAAQPRRIDDESRDRHLALARDGALPLVEASLGFGSLEWEWAWVGVATASLGTIHQVAEVA